MTIPTHEATYPRLLADVGGTNVRLAAIRAPGAPISDERSYACAQFDGLLGSIRAYLDEVGLAPTRAAIGIATAVAGDEIRMTNLGWRFSRAALRADLRLDVLHVINDFTALALALPTLAANERRQIGGGNEDANLPIALLGAGTGLGVSGLIPAHAQNGTPHWIPLQGEGGHVSFSPFNHKEDEILRILRARFGHVSAERLLSGPGIVNLYSALAELNGAAVELATAADITERGVADTCTLCREVVDTFSGMLGTAAANLVITLGARGGLYIGGGIVPKLGDYFDRSPFRARFEQKGRFSNYLAAVPSYVVLAANPALRGAAASLDGAG